MIEAMAALCELICSRAAVAQSPTRMAHVFVMPMPSVCFSWFLKAYYRWKT